MIAGRVLGRGSVVFTMRYCLVMGISVFLKVGDLAVVGSRLLGFQSWVLNSISCIYLLIVMGLESTGRCFAEVLRPQGCRLSSEGERYFVR